MNAIPSANKKPNPKLSTGATFFPRLRRMRPTADITSPAIIGLISKLIP